jgi:hypothetical protein
MAKRFTAFVGSKIVSSGEIEQVALASRAHAASPEHGPLIVFDDASGRVIDLDLRGSEADVLARLDEHPLLDRSPAPRRGPGRPKLGVVSREISLLPRHWDWLGRQPRSASATLRTLVEERMQRDAGAPNLDAVYRVMSTLAGDLPGFEEASRALFGDEPTAFDTEIAGWPEDVRSYLASVGSDVRLDQSDLTP